MKEPINTTTKKYNLRGQLWEVFKVTEWKDDCVYRTKSLGLIVATSSQIAVKRPEAMQTAISFKYSGKLLGL